jgi:hypothetical protein
MPIIFNFIRLHDPGSIFFNANQNSREEILALRRKKARRQLRLRAWLD